MLTEILNADIAIADLSTLNANVMWELGVRHALKPRHTIMICESDQMKAIPFDIARFVLREYTYSPDGITADEIDRFHKLLTKLVNGILAEGEKSMDSPVYEHLKDQLAARAINALPPGSITNEEGESFATIFAKAEEAKKAKDFKTALALLGIAREFAENNTALRDNLSLIICRQALCTYQSEQPDKKMALLKAEQILEPLNPKDSNDVEVLGLSGAINKRLSEIDDNPEFVQKSTFFYDRGFRLKEDYYNGINACFMYYTQACLGKKRGENTKKVLTKAQSTCNDVLDICEKRENDPGFEKSNDYIWVLLTIAEVYNYQVDRGKMEEYEAKAQAEADRTGDKFAMGSYYVQKKKITALYACINS